MLLTSQCRIHRDGEGMRATDTVLALSALMLSFAGCSNDVPSGEENAEFAAQILETWNI